PFGLPGVLAGDVARDVIRLRRDLLLLLLKGALLREASLGSLDDESLVGAGVGNSGLSLEVQNVIDGRAEKRAIVADQQHRAIEIAQVLFQPLRRIEVEVI